MCNMYWIQCHACSVWRQLKEQPSCQAMWQCSMHPDPFISGCDGDLYNFCLPQTSSTDSLGSSLVSLALPHHAIWLYFPESDVRCCQCQLPQAMTTADSLALIRSGRGLFYFLPSSVPICKLAHPGRLGSVQRLQQMASPARRPSSRPGRGHLVLLHAPGLPTKVLPTACQQSPPLRNAVQRCLPLRGFPDCCAPQGLLRRCRAPPPPGRPPAVTRDSTDSLVS
jgi:hypothetical protein